MDFLRGVVNEFSDLQKLQKRFLYEINEDLGFPKPTQIRFYTGGIKDQDPIKWEKTDYGYKGTIKTLGVEKAKVKLCEDGLEVSGKNIVDDKDFGITMPLPINKNILNNIKEIKHKTIAGVTIVELILKEIDVKVIDMNE